MEGNVLRIHSTRSFIVSVTSNVPDHPVSSYSDSWYGRQGTSLHCCEWCHPTATLLHTITNLKGTHSQTKKQRQWKLGKKVFHKIPPATFFSCCCKWEWIWVLMQHSEWQQWHCFLLCFKLFKFYVCNIIFKDTAAGVWFWFCYF